MTIALYAASLERRRLSPQTIRLRLFYVRKLAEHLDLDTATPDELEAFVAQHQDRWKPATVTSVIASIRSYYSWATRTGRALTNPAVDLIAPRVYRTPQRMATDTEIRHGLDTATDITDQAMILLGAECGLRVSEIAGLHRDNRDGEWLTLIGKGGKQRTVWCSPELAALLDRIEHTRMRWGYFFPGKSGGHVHPSTVWRHVRGTTGVPTHSLRRRAITTVYNAGKDIRAAQEFAGHEKVETTAIYVQVIRDTLRTAGEATRIAA